ARGVPVRWLSTGFLVALALAVAVTVQIVGTLLIFALLVAPGAAAQRLAARPGVGLMLTIAISLLSTWLGLAAAYFSGLPVGYFIVLLNQVFTSDALGHVAFTGGLGGLLAGWPLIASVFGSTVAGAVGIGSLGGRARGRDVAIGTVFAWVLGVGVLFLSLYTT